MRRRRIEIPLCRCNAANCVAGCTHPVRHVPVPLDLADVIGALLIVAYMIGCPIVIFLLWT